MSPGQALLGSREKGAKICGFIAGWRLRPTQTPDPREQDWRTELQAPVSSRALGFRKATGAATEGSHPRLWDPTLVRWGSRSFCVWASAVGRRGCSGQFVEDGA